jgi:hypothetical protein
MKKIVRASEERGGLVLETVTFAPWSPTQPSGQSGQT